MKLRHLLFAAIVAIPLVSKAEGSAAEPSEEGEHLEQELALDLGVEESEAPAPTAGLLYGLELGHHEFIVGAALVREEGATAFADATLGYYHSWVLGPVKPEIGLELGVVNHLVGEGEAKERHLAPLERLGFGLIHDFSERFFAGLVGDVGFTKASFAEARGMLELGVKL